MTIYYRCDGVVSIVGNGNNQGSKCSTGWLTVDEPVYQLATREQAGELIFAILSLILLWAVFKIILNTMGIKL